MSRSRKNMTRKNKGQSNSNEQQIILYFTEMLNTIKIYHWKTTSHPTHKATDDLHSSLSGNVDKFVEIMLGKHGGRVSLNHVKMIEFKDFNSIESFKSEINKYKQFMKNMDTMFPSETDLLNIRDEMLGELNQFTYLLTFH
jgi:hypothetical protein